MEKLKKFCTELAEKFPWYDMENQVNAKIFAIETENENKEFWDTLNKVLEAHKTENPLRCVEVIDFFLTVAGCSVKIFKRNVFLFQYRSYAFEHGGKLTEQQHFM